MSRTLVANRDYRPVETHQMHLRPADFFAANPALDVPTKKNGTSVLVPCCGEGKPTGVNGTNAANGSH